MELYFIRHGQSQNNANSQDPNYSESSDPELTEIGSAQAALLAEYFKKNQALDNNQTGWNIQNQYGFGFTHIYTSLMIRAIGTAAPTALSLGCPFAVWSEIHEEGGIFSRNDKNNPLGLPGKTRSYFEQNFPQLSLPEKLDESGWWNRPFEAEQQRQPRADQFLAELLARHSDREGQPENRVALFSHGGFFVRLMCAMLKLHWRQASNDLKSWFLLNNGSISRFDIRKDELTICYLNRTDHFPAHLIT